MNTGIAYLKSKVADFEPSWAMFDREDLKGRMTMLNDMRETIGAALKFLGYSLNTTDAEELARAKEVVLSWKKNLAKFENEQYKTGIASGEFLLVHGYSGDILQVQAENADIAFAMPREGTVDLRATTWSSPRRPRKSGLAHAFINFLHDPAVAAENTEFIQYLCPNKDAYPSARARTPGRTRGSSWPPRSGPRARSSPTWARPTPSTSRSGTRSSPRARKEAMKTCRFARATSALVFLAGLTFGISRQQTVPYSGLCPELADPVKRLNEVGQVLRRPGCRQPERTL